MSECWKREDLEHALASAKAEYWEDDEFIVSILMGPKSPDWDRVPLGPSLTKQKAHVVSQWLRSTFKSKDA